VPFRNISADPAGTACLVDGTCGNLAGKVTHLAELRVIPWLTSQRYSDVTNFPMTAGELGADGLLTGTFRQAGNRIFLNISLIDGKSGLMEWADDLELPAEREAAARIDGCSPWDIYWRVAMPTAWPATATLAIIEFLASWNTFLWPLIVTNSETMRTRASDQVIRPVPGWPG